MGTSFFINANGDMLTAAHVFNDLPRISEGEKQNQYVSTADGSFYLPPVADDELRDAKWLDVLVLHTGHHTRCYIPLKSSTKLEEDAPLMTAGFPGGYDTAAPASENPQSQLKIQHAEFASRGKFSPLRSVLLIKFHSESGASGSPMLTDDGYAVGILTEKMNEKVAYAVPLETVPSVASFITGSESP